jgi:hypothetical protein
MDLDGMAMFLDRGLNDAAATGVPRGERRKVS